MHARFDQADHVIGHNRRVLFGNEKLLAQVTEPPQALQVIFQLPVSMYGLQTSKES